VIRNEEYKKGRKGKGGRIKERKESGREWRREEERLRERKRRERGDERGKKIRK
jgi:hypothetical protein